MSLEYSFSGSGNYIIYSNLKFLNLTMFKIQGLLFKDKLNLGFQLIY